MTLSASYRFPKQVTLSGFHIHTGSALISGPVTINSTLTSTLSDPSGTGVVSLTVDVPPVAGASLSALQGLFANPSNYYINIHTSDFPGGIIRATLRKADLQTFQVTMLPSNEVPAVTCAGCSGIANVGIATISGSDGSVVGGFAIFDVNYRLPAATNITGLHIHDGNSTVSGPVRINTGITSQPTTSDGFGNVFVMAPAQLTAASLVTLNSILVSPENQYVNLHTTELPGGAFRSQLAAANTAVPAITGATNAVFSTAVTGVAPLGLASVFGTNLSKVTADLGGGNTLPDSLGGTTLTVGGKLARLLFVSPAQINFQVPESAASGSQALAVSNVNGAGPASTITVAATAPAIFSNASGSGAILKNIDFSMVSAANPATAGDLVLVFSTGLGLTTPPLATGDLAPIYPTYQTAPTTATIGGQAATVVYSVAAPGFAGLYQTALQVPTGLTPGSVNVALTVGGVTSNTVTMTVK